jgi:anaerobic magnesium-protoporphyrin IX monomethyl ester cyclase
MKILLVNPPWFDGERQGVRAGSRWPHLKIPEEERYMPYPFFLGYSSSLLKINNFNVKCIDAIAEHMSYEEFKAEVKNYNPDIILSETSTPSVVHDMALLKELKDEFKFKLIVAGPDANIFTKEFMKNYSIVDYVLIGEYDMTCLELCIDLKQKKSPKNVQGIIYRQKNKIIFTEKRPLFMKIDNIPWPDREDFPIYNYHDCPGGIPEPSAQMWGSRGCPYQCIFCLWPQIMYNGSNYRTRDVKDVVDEIEYLIKKKNFKSVYFDDDTFNIGKKRMIDIAHEIIKRDLNIPWAFMGRADLSDEETLIELRKSGLTAVKYGMESGVQKLVDNSEKNLNIKTAVENILITKRLGIKVHLTFTFGLPGETKKTIQETINLVKFLDPDSVQFSITTPFPGTKLYQIMEKEGNIVSHDWKDYDGNTKSVIKTNALSPEELKQAQDSAYKIWFDHKFLKQRYSQLSPLKLFHECLRQHGLNYTIKKTINYVKDNRYLRYVKSKKKNKIVIE